MLEPKLVSVKCTQNRVTYEENGNLGHLIMLPNGFEGEVVLDLGNGEVKVDLDVLKRALEDDSKNQYKTYPFLTDLKEILQNDIDNIKEHSFSFPTLKTYVDITDYEFNNFSKIEKTTIVGDGLWIGNGIRKIELEFDDNFNEFIQTARKKEDNEEKKIGMKLVINEKNNDKFSELFIDELEFKIIKKDKFIILLDTDKFIDFFEQSEKTHTFYGYIDVNLRQEEIAGLRDKFVSYSFRFPFEIRLKNPLYSGAHKATEKIGIDFGTSSTCVAKDKGSDLVAFNDHPKDLLDYENMTALVLYNWKKIYQAWRKDNKTLPHFNRNKHFNDLDEIDLAQDHFDYGQNVKEELTIDPSPKTLEAVLTNIKSIPGKLEDDPENKDIVIPFDKETFKKQVFLTDKVEDEDEQHLNPIALYGYLIGRSLNLQIKDEIYTKYTITMPVKFSDYQKERILESLEYGLKRALPKTLRDKLEVSHDYEESVALLGAAKKMKELRIKKSDNIKAIPFAVFDFGGGTLDFAFGFYRKANDENGVFENEEEIYRDIIEIFKTDGVKIGGETLINSIAYRLYVDNKVEMQDNEIPILVPENETKLKDYPQGLFSNSHIAKVNLQTLSENIARKIFVNLDEDIDNISVELFSLHNDKDPIEITISVNKDNIIEFLGDKIYDLVGNFIKITEDVMKENIERLNLFDIEYIDLSKIKIFQAGNTCKSKIVQTAFEELAGDAQVIFIEDEDKEITPKNAVAKGCLMLEGTGVKNHSQVLVNGMKLQPIDRYVWNIEDIEEDEDEAQAVIKAGDNSNSEWKNISLISNGGFSVYYSFVSVLEDGEDDDELLHHTITLPQEFKEEGKATIWAKPYDGKYIECVVGNRKGDNLNETKKMIIDLDNGNIEIKD